MWTDVRPGDVVTLPRTGAAFKVSERDDRHGWWCTSYGGGRRYRLTAYREARGLAVVRRRAYPPMPGGAS